MKKIFTFFTLLTCTFLLFAEKPLVQDIQAIAGNGKKINIIWNNPEKPDQDITKILVYRDIKPISSYKAIEKLKPIAELEPYISNYTDTVNDFLDYYYAVITVTDKPYDIVLLSINATNSGTHLMYKSPEKEKPIVEKKEQLYPEGNLREKPLPYIDYIDGLETQEFISQETLEIAKRLSTKNSSQKEILSPYYFEEDLISPDGGDDYLLFDILKNFFVKRDYKQSIVMFERLVGTNIKSSTRNRAYFYLAESQYFLGNYSEAVRTFIRIEKEYPIICKKWIDSSLDLLQN